MRSLKVLASGSLTFAGVGGRAMAAEGISSPFGIADLSIIGFTAIPRRLPLILRRIRETADAVIAARPDVLVLIDGPDFTHRVARRVRAVAPSIPIIDYVSPTIWAWRPGRARAMRAYVDCVLAILPFESEAHRRLGGPPCLYVGHPLIERLDDLRPNSAEAIRRNVSPPLVLVLPGSRSGEIKRLLAIFGDAIARLAARFGAMDLVLPTVPHLAARVEAGIADWPVRPRLVVDTAEKWAAFRKARAALAASGTVTLELALSGVPTVAAYRVSWFEAMVARRVLKVPSVILANLVIGDNVVPEFLQEFCTAESLAEALFPLLSDGPERARQIEAFARLDGIMSRAGAPPSDRAAAAVLTVALGGAGAVAAIANVA
jgi:lipid-A-disaccharide synthase